MTKQFQILQRRFGDARPGLQLISVKNAAVPVTVVRADLLAQEKKALPITEEFTLRFVARGVDTPVEIAAYLGLDTSHILDAAAAQVSENNLRRGLDSRLVLTQQGIETERTLAATQPVLRQFPIAFDRLAWRLADYHESALVTKQAAREMGMIILPAERNARIGLDDVTASGFNALLNRDRFQVLRIHKVTTKMHRYLPVQLLVYGDTARNELELAVCIDDDLAPDHGHALDKAEAVKRLDLGLTPAGPMPLADPSPASEPMPPDAKA